MSLGKYDTADNINLEKIFLDVEEHHVGKFGRAPKLFRRVGSALEMEGAGEGMRDKPGGVRAGAGGGSARDRAGVRRSSEENTSYGGGGGGGGGGGVYHGRSGFPPAAGTSAAAAGAERPPGARHRSGSAPRPQRGYGMGAGGGNVQNNNNNNNNAGGPPRGAAALGVGPAFGRGESNGGANNGRRGPLLAGGGGAGAGASDLGGVGGLSVNAAPVSYQRQQKGGGGGGGGGPEGDFDAARTELPALPDFGTSDLNELASSIQRDIFLDNPNVPWDSVAGLEEAKKLLKEAVVMPIKYPEFFTGLLAPWRGILLYGPPGTGKTMLAKAVATECRTTFFNISASTVVSKWRGDSEKLIRVLFELARHYAPSTVFLDEIDALMSARGGGGGGGGEHEASRRMKTELLIQMDGLAKKTTQGGGEMVFLLAATNLPWELDLAMLRRLEKRILVNLPNEEARAHIIGKLLAPHKVDADVSLRDVAAATEGYSGSDVMLLCKEMAMRPLRRLMAQLECGPLLEYGNALGPPKRERGPAAVGPITSEDVAAGMAVTKPSAMLHLQRYVTWSEKYGQTG